MTRKNVIQIVEYTLQILRSIKKQIEKELKNKQ